MEIRNDPVRKKIPARPDVECPQERGLNVTTLPPVSFEVLLIFSRVFPWIRLDQLQKRLYRHYLGHLLL